MMRSLRCVGLLSLCAACGAARSAEQVSGTSLVGTDQQSHALPASGASALTVLIFFSADCDCQTAHDERLRALHRRYQPRGVSFFAVDSEVSASPERDAAEARRRAYPYPILIDRRAALAKALGAEYATFTVVIDRQGRVRYAGAIDSDQAHLTDDATPYLRHALESLLAGREPSVTRVEALGCALQLW